MVQPQPKHQDWSHLVRLEDAECIHELQSEVQHRVHSLSRLREKQLDSSSPEYKEELKALAKAWFLLRYVRDPEEFLPY